MGIKGGHRGNNNGFGNLCNLKRVIPTSATTAIARAVTESELEEDTDTDKIPNTRILRISEPLYQKFVDFSHRFYNVESYDFILENLLKDFEEHNQDKRWRDIIE